MKDPIVILFYKFIDIADPKALRDEQFALADKHHLKGRAIVATEGINATFEGEREDIDKYKTEFLKNPLFSDVIFKESVGTGRAFPRLSVKVRDEIVALGAGKFDPQTETANQLPADELEKWYENGEDFIILDLRNDYEITSGAFEKTYDPGLRNFRDLPSKLDEIKHLKDKKIVTVCTGGIRCEKATCLLKKEGFSDLYQLKDGIHTYMQKYPASHFKGTLFVFDNRMTTPVVDVDGRPIIGKCEFCGTQTEEYANDDTVRPSKKILCCKECFEENKNSLREVVTLK